jgi:hypothetical protein
MYINFDLPGDITPIVTPVHFSQHSFITSVLQGESFLNTGVTFANFHSVGNILVDNERLKD